MAVGRGARTEKKIAYDEKLCKLLDIYNQILIVGVDNVGSNQLQGIRAGLRGDSIILMGKNTMMKRSIRVHAEKTGNTAILSLIPLLVVLNIPTKINKGTVEITTNVDLIKKGDKVGSSEAALLSKLVGTFQVVGRLSSKSAEG
uniref:Uncharacterized protein n=1 Tax=Daucus carota subsp. sativus TaxID=79200 RepID=A0A161XVB4_DAUCS